MVDDGSGACINHPQVLVQMRLEDKITPRCITLTGFNNAVERTSGEIILPVLARGVTLETTFHIMDQDTAYNAIIGRPWIHAMRATLSSLYQAINFPTSWGIFSIRDIPGIPKDIAMHKLNVDPFYPPVQQVRRKFNTAINEAVSVEVDKLLANGSIQESKYPQWIANVVMVKKKNGK
uniref:Uncharacterized protein LOC104216795 n=1 Tax=Nicotiana sylvestris TaxID=4096 RepID=A0A1U7VB21_NICSY|nr:PREDICTED: uncharacterized protein LOC104216795 [Nicotiana sylvestris]